MRPNPVDHRDPARGPARRLHGRLRRSDGPTDGLLVLAGDTADAELRRMVRRRGSRTRRDRGDAGRRPRGSRPVVPTSSSPGWATASLRTSDPIEAGTDPTWREPDARGAHRRSGRGPGLLPDLGSRGRPVRGPRRRPRGDAAPEPHRPIDRVRVRDRPRSARSPPRRRPGSVATSWPSSTGTADSRQRSSSTRRAARSVRDLPARGCSAHRPTGRSSRWRVTRRPGGHPDDRWLARRATGPRSGRSTHRADALATIALALDRDGSRLAIAWLTDGGTISVAIHEREAGWRRVAAPDVGEAMRRGRRLAALTERVRRRDAVRRSGPAGRREDRDLGLLGQHHAEDLLEGQEMDARTPTLEVVAGASPLTGVEARRGGCRCRHGR